MCSNPLWLECYRKRELLKQVIRGEAQITVEGETGWSYKSKMDSHPTKLEEGRKSFPLEPLGEVWPCWLLVSWTGRGCISLVLRHPDHGDFVTVAWGILYNDREQFFAFLHLHSLVPVFWPLLDQASKSQSQQESSLPISLQLTSRAWRPSPNIAEAAPTLHLDCILFKSQHHSPEKQIPGHAPSFPSLPLHALSHQSVLWLFVPIFPPPGDLPHSAHPAVIFHKSLTNSSTQVRTELARDFCRPRPSVNPFLYTLASTLTLILVNKCSSDFFCFI